VIISDWKTTTFNDQAGGDFADMAVIQPENQIFIGFSRIFEVIAGG
jgi:hypothetical protein